MWLQNIRYKSKLLHKIAYANHKSRIAHEHLKSINVIVLEPNRIFEGKFFSLPTRNDKWRFSNFFTFLKNMIFFFCFWIVLLFLGEKGREIVSM